MRASFSDRFYIAAPQGVAVKLSDMLSSAQIIPSGVVHTGDEAVRAAKDGALLLTTYRLPDMTGEDGFFVFGGRCKNSRRSFVYLTETGGAICGKVWYTGFRVKFQKRGKSVHKKGIGFV